MKLNKLALEEMIACDVEDLGLSDLAQNLLNNQDVSKDIFSLYLCAHRLDSPMLSSMPKIMRTIDDISYWCKKTLYVAGRWNSLGLFVFLERYGDMFSSHNFVEFNFETTVLDKTMTYEFSYSNKTIIFVITDEFLGVVEKTPIVKYLRFYI